MWLRERCKTHDTLQSQNATHHSPPSEAPAATTYHTIRQQAQGEVLCQRCGAILAHNSVKLCVACCVPLCDNNRCGKTCDPPTPGSTGNASACGAMFCPLCYSQHICFTPRDADAHADIQVPDPTCTHLLPSPCDQSEEQDSAWAAFDEHIPKEVFNLEVFRAPVYSFPDAEGEQ